MPFQVLADPEQQQDLVAKTGSKYFPAEYVEDVFFVWYNSGKPGGNALRDIIQPVLGTTVRPTKNQLIQLIQTVFSQRATDLDAQAVNAMTEQVVGEKVAMLKRHSELGRKMQTMALEYLDAHADDLNPQTAARLLVDGVRIERESAGIPEAIEKMTAMSDTDLLNEVEKIIKGSPSKVERIEENV